MELTSCGPSATLPKRPRSYDLVQMTLYGLKTGTSSVVKELKDALVSLRYSQLQSDTAVYISFDRQLIVCTQVDDFLITRIELKEIEHLATSRMGQ